MTPSSLQHTERLTALTNAKVEVLEKLRDLARVQAEVTRSCDATELLNFLSRKQPLMDQLAAVQSELNVYSQDDPDQRQWRSSEARQSCRKQVERCQLVLSEIVLLEKQTLDEMIERRDAIASQLQNGRDATAAATAYRTSEYLVEGSLDLTSTV